MKNEIRSTGKVIGCNNMGSRPDTWIHINANGDVFICCNDYDFETVFGNVNEKSIKEIWESQQRKDMIKHSYNTLCRTCVHAIWEEE
jgi:radical SAM protein with 4Fe4S-binding SPASM domain